MNIVLENFSTMVRQALSLDGAVYGALVRDPNRWFYALTVVLLAGLSEATAQSIVLFVNRVRPKRFGLALIISTFSNLAGYLLWSVIVWLIGVYVFDRNTAWAPVACVVGLAYAPKLFAFFSLIPFFGIGISHLLSLWSMLVIVVALSFGLNLEVWQAAIAGGMGWLALQIWQRTLGLPIHYIDRWLKNRVAGVPLQLTMDDVDALRRSHWPLLQNWTQQQTSPDQSVPMPPLSQQVKTPVKGNR